MRSPSFRFGPALAALALVLIFKSSWAGSPAEPPAGAAPVIHRVEVFGPNLFIHGANFGVREVPAAFLGGGRLQISSHSPTVVVAPMSATFPPGSYPLWLSSAQTPGLRRWAGGGLLSM